jgi:hypothetical protein
VGCHKSSASIGNCVVSSCGRAVLRPPLKTHPGILGGMSATAIGVSSVGVVVVYHNYFDGAAGLAKTERSVFLHRGAGAVCRDNDRDERIRHLLPFSLIGRRIFDLTGC